MPVNEYNTEWGASNGDLSVTSEIFLDLFSLSFIGRRIKEQS